MNSYSKGLRKAKGATGFKKYLITMKKQYQKQIMVLLGIVFLLIFSYYPMYGVQIAFKKLSLREGIWASPWVGFEHFKIFLTNSYFGTTMLNTLKISLTSLIIVFPAPIIFALMLNEISHLRFKKSIQTVSYLPHFVSWVVVAGMIYNMLSMDGLANNLMTLLGLIDKPTLILGKPSVFLPMVVISSVWKSVGFSSIIYLSALASIDVELYEAAVVDGASKLKRIWYITIPGILPTISILFIFACSGLLDTNFDQIYLLQNQSILSVSETLDTYAYKMGIESARFEYGTAVSLFKAAAGFILLVIANKTTKALTEQGVW